MTTSLSVSWLKPECNRVWLVAVAKHGFGEWELRWTARFGRVQLSCSFGHG